VDVAGDVMGDRFLDPARACHRSTVAAHSLSDEAKTVTLFLVPVFLVPDGK